MEQDGFRWSEVGHHTIVGIQQHEPGDPISMGKCPINGWRTRSVVGDQHLLLEMQLLNDGVEVPHLIGCGVGIASGLIRFAPAEKIKGHDPARGDQPGKQAIVEMQIVWKAMQQDDGGLLARILTRVDVIGTALDDMFRVRYGLLLEHKFLLISCLCTYYHKKLD